MSEEDKRIIVEIFSHQEAERLRAEMRQMDARHKEEIERLEKRIQGLHMTLYEALETLRNLRGRR